MMKKLIIAVSMLTFSTTAVSSTKDYGKIACEIITQLSYDIVYQKNKGLSKTDALRALNLLGKDTPRNKEIEYIYANDITDASLHRETQYEKCIAK